MMSVRLLYQRVHAAGCTWLRVGPRYRITTVALLAIIQPYCLVEIILLVENEMRNRAFLRSQRKSLARIPTTFIFVSVHENSALRSPLAYLGLCD